MPKKIILKIKQEPQQSSPDVEPVPTQPIGEITQVREEKAEEPSKEIGDLDEALRMYDELMKEVERLKNLDKNFITYCLRLEELRPQLIRSILARLAERRNAVVEKAADVLEKLKSARDVLGSEFAEIEGELIWSSIELNTMQLEGEKADQKNVGLKEELEARIPELRKKLTNLRNRLKVIEDMVKQLSDLPRNIVELTTNKDEVSKLFEDLKKRYMLNHGPRAEAVLRAEIERVAQQEAIPREYAILLVWRASIGR